MTLQGVMCACINVMMKGFGRATADDRYLDENG
jgi:hypothetical protein